jgi:hypothetical protein
MGNPSTTRRPRRNAVTSAGAFRASDTLARYSSVRPIPCRRRREHAFRMAWNETSTCEHCHQAIPATEGRGRRRRYCSATCRSAARRERDEAARREAGLLEPWAVRREADRLASLAILHALKTDLLQLGTLGANAPQVEAELRRVAERLRYGRW